ncbi:MAG: SDR family NAD(P)-dependent oxidoreductase [Candidatus Micrarchaeia archaeon]
MRILVTGAAGFIGSHVCEALVSRGNNVIGVDNFDSFLYNRRIKERNIAALKKNRLFKLVRADIRDTKRMKSLVAQAKPEAVIHLAAKAGVRPSLERPLEYADVNVNGTISLLEACKNAKLKTFIFGSSSSVYGINNKVPFSEEDPIAQPISPYAASKRAAELFCFTYSHLYGIPVTVLRLFTVYGPRQRPDLAIHKFVRLISEGKEIPVFGDGSMKRDYTYIDDIVQGILAALEKPFSFEIFNLGGSRTVSLNELITLIEKNVGKKAKITHLPPQPGDVPITYADISKARRMLGYEPRTSIDEGIKKFVRWFRENG